MWFLPDSPYTVGTCDRVERVEVERSARSCGLPWRDLGLEHLRLVTSDGGVVANGLVIGLEAGRPFRIGYEIRCDGREGAGSPGGRPRTWSGRSSSCSPMGRATGREVPENPYPSSMGASTSTSWRRLHQHSSYPQARA